MNWIENTAVRNWNFCYSKNQYYFLELLIYRFEVILKANILWESIWLLNGLRKVAVGYW